VIDDSRCHVFKAMARTSFLSELPSGRQLVDGLLE